LVRVDDPRVDELAQLQQPRGVLLVEPARDLLDRSALP
jgi:hypothetical protein